MCRLQPADPPGAYARLRLPGLVVMPPPPPETCSRACQCLARAWTVTAHSRGFAMMVKPVAGGGGDEDARDVDSRAHKHLPACTHKRISGACPHKRLQ